MLRKNIILLFCLLIFALTGCAKNEQISKVEKPKDDFDISIAEDKKDPATANNYTTEYYDKLYKENALLNEKLKIYSESELVYDSAKAEYIASQIDAQSINDEIAFASRKMPHKVGVVDIDKLNSEADAVSVEVNVPEVSEEELYERITELEARNKAISERIEEIRNSY